MRTHQETKNPFLRKKGCWIRRGKKSQNWQQVVETARNFLQWEFTGNPGRTAAPMPPTLLVFQPSGWGFGQGLCHPVFSILLRSLPYADSEWETVSCNHKQPLQLSAPGKTLPAQEVLKCASEGIELSLCLQHFCLSCSWMPYAEAKVSLTQHWEVSFWIIN